MTNARKVTARLFECYPDPKLVLNFKSPLELLVATILSAQCTDARVNEVTKGLFKKYKSARQYAMADLKVFEEEIRPTGFYKNKAKMVTNCCKKLVEDFNGKVPSSVNKLTTLPGVGRKTANMVLGNAFGKEEGIAVDTHVLRVSNRLGLAQSKNAEEVETELMKQVPKGKWTSVSNAMILFGRETCTARKPRCGECILFKECEWPDKSS
ncbi:MAG: endonuclease III [Acidiferrobacterales bacterium]